MQGGPCDPLISPANTEPLGSAFRACPPHGHLSPLNSAPASGRSPQPLGHRSALGTPGRPSAEPSSSRILGTVRDTAALQLPRPGSRPLLSAPPLPTSLHSKSSAPSYLAMKRTAGLSPHRPSCLDPGEQGHACALASTWGPGRPGLLASGAELPKAHHPLGEDSEDRHVPPGLVAASQDLRATRGTLPPVSSHPLECLLFCYCC